MIEHIECLYDGSDVHQCDCTACYEKRIEQLEAENKHLHIIIDFKLNGCTFEQIQRKYGMNETEVNEILRMYLYFFFILNFNDM